MLLREPYFVPESKPAVELFRAFRKRKQSLALTVDEYGGVTGLVSMEDLLECIFGDIRSASDEMIDEPRFKAFADGSSRLEGSMPVEQFNQELGGELDDTKAETVGGLLLHAYGELPPEGTKIVFGTLEFTVVRLHHNRIREVTVVKLPDAEQPDAPDSTPESPSSPPTAAVGATDGLQSPRGGTHDREETRD
jgi:putative hemolysin